MQTRLYGSVYLVDRHDRRHILLADHSDGFDMSVVLDRTAHRVLVGSLIVALLCTMAVGPVAAQSVQGASGTVVVEEGETVSSIEAVAGSIVVRGTVTGDVAGLAGTIRVAEGGTVGGSVAGAAGEVRIDGTVGGNVNAGSGNVRVSDTASVGGDVAVGAGAVLLDGRIDGDVQIGAETISVGPNAVIGGELRYDAAEFSRDPAATVGGGVVNDPNLGGGGGGIGAVTVPNWAAAGYSLLANLVLGAILLLVFPAFSARVAGRVADSPAKTGGVGLVTLIGVPIAIVLIAITIIGIPLAVLSAMAYGLGIWVAGVYGQYAVGAWVLRQGGRDDRWLALIAGLVGFAVLGLIPILGGVLEFVALLLGLGALALGLRDAFRGRQAGPSDRQTTFDDTFTDTAGGTAAEGTAEAENP